MAIKATKKISGFKAFAQAVAFEARYRLYAWESRGAAWAWPLLDPDEYAMRSDCIARVYNNLRNLTLGELQSEDRRIRGWWWHQNIQMDHSDCERCGNRKAA